MNCLKKSLHIFSLLVCSIVTLVIRGLTSNWWVQFDRVKNYWLSIQSDWIQNNIIDNQFDSIGGNFWNQFKIDQFITLNIDFRRIFSELNWYFHAKCANLQIFIVRILKTFKIFETLFKKSIPILKYLNIWRQPPSSKFGVRVIWCNIRSILLSY